MWSELITVGREVFQASPSQSACMRMVFMDNPASKASGNAEEALAVHVPAGHHYGRWADGGRALVSHDSIPEGFEVGHRDYSKS